MFRLSALLSVRNVRRIKASMQSVKIVLYKGGNDLKKPIKIILCVLVVSLVFFSMFKPFTSDTSETSEASENVRVYVSSDGTEKHIYEDSEEFYERAQSIIDERKKNLEKKSITTTFTAYADKTSFYYELLTDTRFTDEWFMGPASGAVNTAFDIIANTVRVDTSSGTAEMKIQQMYEFTGKIGLSYLAYIDGDWQTVLTETVTAFYPSIPWSTRINGSMIDPPDWPQWTGRSLYPNEVAFKRELDTGDISYFILNADQDGIIGIHATSTNGSDGHGHDASGSSFQYPNRTCYIEDSTGHHDFQSNGDYYISFITPYVNSIYTVLGEQYRSTFMTNLTLADNVHTFYCSYALTNTPEISDAVLDVTNVNNNWTFNQFPIYRITNENFYPNNCYGDYRVYNHYLDQTTINNYSDYGFDYDSVNGTLDLDPTVLAGALAGALIPEFQGAFDLIYGAQPAIGMDFNATNNVLDYLDLIEDNQGGGGGEVWIPPEYPELTTYDIVVRPVFPATTEALPSYLPTQASNIYSLADRLLSPEILPIYLALALFGLCIAILL